MYKLPSRLRRTPPILGGEFYSDICLMTTKERYKRVLAYFEENNAPAETELNYTNPYELIVAVALSAQCTDKRVNMVTPTLFKRFPDVDTMAASNPEEVFEYIKSISYPNNKAKHLVGMAQMLKEKFNGEVPATIDELVQLPGVGHKTANVIASVVFDQPTMAVDTHVYRVSRRIGLAPVTATTPLAVEKELIKYIPEALVPKAHHWLILHGRYVCVARSPKCAECGLKPVCLYFQGKVDVA